MKLDEIHAIVTASSADDWEQIHGRAVFIHELGEAQSGDGQHWVTVDSHHSLAVWKDDVSLRLAYGLEEDGDHNLTFKGVEFPDRKIWRCYADVFWQGALVARWAYLVVDSGRCYLPDLKEVWDGVAESPADQSKWTFRGVQASANNLRVARLLNDLVGRPADDGLDQYMKRGGIIEIAD